MKARYFITLIFLLFFINCKSQNTTLYVGTYTKGESKGIYKLDFNTKTGKLSNKELAITTQNPSFIAYAPNKKYLYAVGGGETSSISAFKLEENGTLKLINTKSSNGKGPCHVSTNVKGDKAVVSNYGGGTISIYNINADGSLNEASQIFNHNKESEKPARAHSAQFFNDELFISDLGRNRVYQYKLINNDYKIESKSIIPIQGNPGPRHFAMSKNGDFIYIINEYGSSITSVKRTASGFTSIDQDSTLDKNYMGKNKCADIHLSKDERFLYGSNRGENSIAVFKRDTNTGKINKIQNISVHGDWPRNFTIDPSGKFLLVANQKSENISVFKVNTFTGVLSFLHDIKVTTPVCLLF